MKKLSMLVIICTLFLSIGGSAAFAQSNKALTMYKNHINKVVKKVEKASSPQQKRLILNRSFDHMIQAFQDVEHMSTISDADRAGLKKMEQTFRNEKHQLNGTHGFQRVSDQQLNNFAHYTQQHVEQANTITISLIALLLIVIIVILIA